jgi:hypothetical protein
MSKEFDKLDCNDCSFDDPTFCSKCKEVFLAGRKSAEIFDRDKIMTASNEETIEDNITSIGSLSNCYGDLQIRKLGEKYFWGLDDASDPKGIDWLEIPKTLYDEVMIWHNPN